MKSNETKNGEGANMITIRNSFHNTEVQVRSTSLSGRTARQVRNTLCGVDGCCCGGTLGERGGDMYGEPAISDDKGNVYDWSPAPGFYDPISYGGGAVELRVVDWRGRE